MFNAAETAERAFYPMTTHPWELWFAWHPVKCNCGWRVGMHLYRKRVHITRTQALTITLARKERKWLDWIYQTPEEHVIEKLSKRKMDAPHFITIDN